MTDEVLYELDGHVATITYNRPSAMNAVNGAMRRGLNDAFSRFRDDEDAWVAIVTGAGRAFCSGGDLRDGAGSIGEFAGTFWEKPTVNSFESGWEIFKPVIAAVNGYCLGYGLTLVTWCDFVIASDRAEFGFPEALLGTPAIVGAIRLPQKVNWQYAMELLMTGERIDAARAKEIGLAGWVVPHDALDGRSPRARGAPPQGCAHRGARDEGGGHALAAPVERRGDPVRRDDAQGRGTRPRTPPRVDGPRPRGDRRSGRAARDDRRLRAHPSTSGPSAHSSGGVDLWSERQNRRPPMADKSPKKPNAKKPGKSLKEKRAAKHAKHDESRTGLGR